MKKCSSLFKRLFCLIALQVVCIAHGSPQNLTIDVLVESQSNTELTRGFQKAFNTAASNITNKEQAFKINENELIRLVSQYQYQYQKNNEELHLLVHFNQAALLDYLRSQNLIANTPENYSLLVWFAFMNNQTQRLIGVENGQTEIELLKNAAKAQNIKLIFPQMDLDDINALSFNDVWNQRQKVIDKASKRYGADGTLLIKLVQTGKEKWHSKWSLNSKLKRGQFKLQDNSLITLMRQGSQQLKDLLIKKQGEQLYWYYIEISDISKVSDYNHYLNYLQTLPGVKLVQLDRVTPEAVLYKLQTNIDIAELKELIDNNHKLSAKEAEAENLLRYRLNT